MKLDLARELALKDRDEHEFFDAYRAFEDVERSRHVADLEEILANDPQPEHQPLRRRHRTDGGDEWRGLVDAAAGCGATS